jgi:hypothetical protein
MDWDGKIMDLRFGVQPNKAWVYRPWGKQRNDNLSITKYCN